MENYKIKMMNNSIYHYPTINLLDSASAIAQDVDLEQLEEQQKHIIDVLRTFCIPINEIKYTLSPSAIRYEIKPKSGQLYAKVRKNEHDISLCLSPMGVRIMSPVPGRNVMVIEIANPAPYTYQLKDIIEATTLKNDDMDLPCAIGKTIDDEIFMFDLAKMPHLLIGGATGQGKTVCLHDIIMSLLFKKSPQELKLVLLDPKKIEFKEYKSLNERYFYRITTEDTKVISDIDSCMEMMGCLSDEMNSRYELLYRAKCRHIAEYNKKIHHNHMPQNAENHIMPYIVVIIDEFSDVAVAGGEEFHSLFLHLLSLSRPVGIHIIFSTYCHDTDIMTGMIKANVPVRIGFRFIDKHASLRLLDRVVQQDYLGVGEAIYSEGSCAFRINTPYLEVPEIEVMIAQINKAH